jgi:hypothetical protein
MGAEKVEMTVGVVLSDADGYKEVIFCFFLSCSLSQ